MGLAVLIIGVLVGLITIGLLAYQKTDDDDRDQSEDDDWPDRDDWEM